MDEFPGLLARDFGFRPQGKSAPMSASKSPAPAPAPAPNPGHGSTRSAPSWNSKPRSAWSSTPAGDSFGISDDRSPPGYDDVFGGPPRYPNPNPTYGRSASSSNPSPAFDNLFDGFKDSGAGAGASGGAKSSTLPVYDKPVYDDDIFDGVPGMKSSANVQYDDVFASISTSKAAEAPEHGAAPPYDDLLENLGRSMADLKVKGSKKEQDLSGFDDLIPGFGGSSPPQKRESAETSQSNTAVLSAKPPTSIPEDPFVVLETTSASTFSSSGLFADPLENIGRPMNSGSATAAASSVSGGVFDDIDAFDGLVKSVPSFVSESNENRKEKNPKRTVPDTSTSENKAQSTQSSDSSSVFGQIINDTYERNGMADQSPKSSEIFETADDVWLTVDEIPLFTQPTSTPPPSRSPPPLVIEQVPFGRTDPTASIGPNARRKDNEYFSQSQYAKGSVKKSNVSPMDELEDFAMGKPQTYVNEHAEVLSSEEDMETNSAAAAMKEAMDRAEAKFKHAKEVRERERDARSAKSREFGHHERDEKTMPDAQDFEDKEKQEKLDCEHAQREREEKEKERRRLEKEKEQEAEREREKARQAVERATREARERAAAEARQKAERAAVGKANAEARQRAERAAVQRAQSEARERAAAEAREKAEKVAIEARERAAAEARERERASTREKAASEARERAAVERAAAEARARAERAAVERANAEARERAAAAAREKQNRTENDLESFFGMGGRATSAPKQRSTTSENPFDAQFQSRGSADGARRTSSNSSSTIRKASSATNIVDDLTSIFGASPSSGEFPEVEGESEERRKARLERHQRTLERAAKALAEKNERDMQTQREQAERHRIAETLDFEIKRWAAGKEGNLRALLSTLQYVLWPECGWQPVSLTDLITGASVKKVYRKATLCIHPDKVQQKGANLQQKYIAEKVFDLLKEAWNKFNSEELF